MINETFELNMSFNPYGMMSGINDKCYDYIHGVYRMNAECVIRDLCPQIQNYYIWYGVGIIILWGLLTWLCYYFFNYWYKKIPNKMILGYNMLDDIDRANLYLFILNRLLWICIIYITVVVVLNW